LKLTNPIKKITYRQFITSRGVRVNCWFCNKNFVVKKEFANCWTCPECENYNGFTEVILIDLFDLFDLLISLNIL